MYWSNIYFFGNSKQYKYSQSDVSENWKVLEQPKYTDNLAFSILIIIGKYFRRAIFWFSHLVTLNTLSISHSPGPLAAGPIHVRNAENMESLPPMNRRGIGRSIWNCSKSKPKSACWFMITWKFKVCLKLLQWVLKLIVLLRISKKVNIWSVQKILSVSISVFSAWNPPQFCSVNFSGRALIIILQLLF